MDDARRPPIRTSLFEGRIYFYLKQKQNVQKSQLDIQQFGDGAYLKRRVEKSSTGYLVWDQLYQLTNIISFS